MGYIVLVASEMVANWEHEMGFPWTEQQAFVALNEMTLAMGREWGIHGEMVT